MRPRSTSSWRGRRGPRPSARWRRRRLRAWPADGHVAISIGSGYAISTTERSVTGVHVFQIAYRNATKPYGGYLIP